MNRHRGVLRFGLDAANAKRLFEALSPDDDAHARTTLEGSEVVCRVEGETIPSLLRAADDVLACAQVALGVAKRIDEDEGSPA